jgi:hypothetical protein
VLAPTSTAAMKLCKLVTSRKLALMASKGCVLVSWQPRHQEDEEAAGEEASTGGADTEPRFQARKKETERPRRGFPFAGSAAAHPAALLL